MKLSQLTIRKLEIPFKVAFQHSSATRAETESVLVVAESQNGQRGFGEGCPRHYVTNETLDSVFQFFENHKAEWLDLRQLDDLKEWTAVHGEDIDRNPAAWCAVELALLDLMARENNQSIESLLSLPELEGKFQYTAVLGSGHFSTFQKQLNQYLEWGFCDFKIKVSGNLEEDREKILFFRERDKESHRMRLDANNLWVNAEEAIAYLQNIEYPFFALEEPLQVGDYDGCRKLQEMFYTPIILDESFLRMDQFKQIERNVETWMINLRVSKMGGLIRSLDIVARARELGLSLIVGAQVGETSILTRAGLTVAHAARNILVAQEGAFGTHLLERDVIELPIMFGAEGKLVPDSFKDKPGLGIDVVLDGE